MNRHVPQDDWGNQLASTSDSVPDGGFQYRFVGAYDVRWDAAMGLYYMRQRWFDPTLQRFMGSVHETERIVR
jgi:RHS repeat-associated protein